MGTRSVRGAGAQRELRGEQPTLTKITIKIYPDANSRLSALKSGEVDALAELGAVLPAQAGEIRDDPNFVVEAYNTACNTYLLLNQSAGAVRRCAHSAGVEPRAESG